MSRQLPAAGATHSYSRAFESVMHFEVVTLKNMRILPWWSIHTAAGAKGPGLTSSVARAYLRFNSMASTLAGKQCWLCASRLLQTVML